MARPRIRLLIPNDPHPMRIERDLAKEIGLNESIVLLQLEYLITISSNERDGRMWTYQSLQDLHEIYFPWWSPTTISRIVKSLEEKELIVIGNYNKLGYDRTQWYALNDVGIARLTSVLMHSDAIFQNEKSIFQNGDMDHVKMKNGSCQNETTIPENTQRVHKERGAEKQPHPPAVQAYFDTYPAQTLDVDQIAEISRTVVDIPRWREVLRYWKMSDYRAQSIPKMLDRYSSGATVADDRPGGKKTANITRPPADLPMRTAADDAGKKITTGAAARRIIEETEAKLRSGK